MFSSGFFLGELSPVKISPLTSLETTPTTADGKFKLENPKKNRARNGHGKNGRLAPGKGTRKSKK